MSDFGNVGKLMQLPLNDIEPSEEGSESEFIVISAAKALLETGGRNWVPIIVKEIGDYQYQIISNHFIYAVAQQAGIEKVWCIVIEPKAQIIEQARILAREVLPKANLATASRETILAALRYLVDEPGSPLKGLDVLVATNKIESADRKSWADFEPITKLKCGITKGKKLDALSTVFYLSAPTPPPKPPESISLKSASRDEIFARLDYLSTYKVNGFEELDADQIADAIFTASKGKWKSLTPITKLDCGVSTAQVKTLKTVFSL